MIDAGRAGIVRRMLQVLGLLAGGYVLVCLLAFVFQTRLVYFPDPNLIATPEHIGLSYRDVDFSAEDGVRLHGWLVPGPGPGPTLLFCHGNAGNVSHRLDSIAVFHELALSVFIFDYRGYGRSGGRPGEAGTYRDAEAAWRHLVEAEGVSPDQIVVFGRSLGGAVAIDLAARHRPRALIVESCFPSALALGARAYPWLPVRLLSRIRYDSRAKVSAVAAPKLFVHSREDDVVPFELGRSLFEAASDPKRFLEIRGTHNQGFVTSERRYVQALADFLGALPGADAGGH